MRHALRYHSSFDASHRVDAEGHDRPHGHTFEVIATIHGELISEGGGISRVARSDGTQARLDAIAAELDSRDLNGMMTGSEPVPEVIATWFLERLPDVHEIEIVMGWRRETGWARRDKR